MHKKLVKYDEWHFVEVDPVRLKRIAMTLRDQIYQKIDRSNDPYLFYTITLPIVEAAIRGEIALSLDEDITEIISGNFNHDESEGYLPVQYDQEFRKAVADFDVTVQGLSMEQTQMVLVDGVTHAWLQFEDEWDFPANVKFP